MNVRNIVLHGRKQVIGVQGCGIIIRPLSNVMPVVMYGDDAPPAGTNPILGVVRIIQNGNVKPVEIPLTIPFRHEGKFERVEIDSPFGFPVSPGLSGSAYVATVEVYEPFDKMPGDARTPVTYGRIYGGVATISPDPDDPGTVDVTRQLVPTTESLVERPYLKGAFFRLTITASGNVTGGKLKEVQLYGGNGELLYEYPDQIVCPDLVATPIETDTLLTQSFRVGYLSARFVPDMGVTEDQEVYLRGMIIGAGV